MGFVADIFSAVASVFGGGSNDNYVEPKVTQQAVEASDGTAEMKAQQDARAREARKRGIMSNVLRSNNDEFSLNSGNKKSLLGE